jgi:hypothetical protein
VELRQLVEKENAKMRQRHLARPAAMAAAHQRRERSRVMRVAEGPLAHQLALSQQARDRMDHADFERFARIERRQQARQTRRQHRFAGARRADHQQIVSTRRRQFERALRRLLAFDVAKVER